MVKTTLYDPGQIRRRVHIISGRSQAHESTIGENLLDSFAHGIGYFEDFICFAHVTEKTPP